MTPFRVWGDNRYRIVATRERENHKGMFHLAFEKNIGNDSFGIPAWVPVVDSEKTSLLHHMCELLAHGLWRQSQGDSFELDEETVDVRKKKKG